MLLQAHLRGVTSRRSSDHEGEHLADIQLNQSNRQDTAGEIRGRPTPRQLLHLIFRDIYRLLGLFCASSEQAKVACVGSGIVFRHLKEELGDLELAYANVTG